MTATLETVALSPAECWRLIRTRSVGRLVYTAFAMPAIRPVRYALHTNRLLLSAGLEEVTDEVAGQIVALETGDIGDTDDTLTGWSVTVLGKATLTTENHWAGADDLALAPPNGLPATILRIDSPRISGSRRDHLDR